MKVVTSIAIYAAPIWDWAMDKRSYRTGIDAAYRRSAFRVISAFHTVSTDAAMVIAGMVPLKLVVNIERRKHNIRSEIDLSIPDQIVMKNGSKTGPISKREDGPTGSYRT